MLSGGLTMSERLFVAVCAGCEASTAWTVKVNVPGAVGVPVMVPAGVRERPAGSWPTVMDQVYGVVPPVAASVWA